MSIDDVTPGLAFEWIHCALFLEELQAPGSTGAPELLPVSEPAPTAAPEART